MIRKDRLVNNFIRMVEIDSVSGQENKMRDYLINEFKKRGLNIKEDNAGQLVHGKSGNLLVKIPGQVDAETLLFCAHMDTVEPGSGIKAIIDENDYIRSAGDTILGSDDKAAIAAILEACDIILENNLLHPPLELLFTVGEEEGLKGAKAFDYSQLQATMGYVLDAGGDPGNIIIKAPCQNLIEYTVYGKSAHAGMNPETGVNAIHLAAKALAQMPCGRIDEETTCNLGIIEGGRARNIVADYCHIRGEARSHNRQKLNTLTEQLQSTFTRVVEEGGGKAEIKVELLYSEINLDPNADVVRLAEKAVRSIGMVPELVATGGGSDASVITNNGIPCVNLAIGMTGVHTCNEHISINNLIKDVELILAIISKSLD